MDVGEPSYLDEMYCTAEKCMLLLSQKNKPCPYMVSMCFFFWSIYFSGASKNMGPPYIIFTGNALLYSSCLFSSV